MTKAPPLRSRTGGCNVSRYVSLLNSILDFDLALASVASAASTSTLATTTQSTSNRSLSVSSASTRATTPVASASASQITFDKFDLLLSLDTALELIHADRESLKRVETFAGYPGHYGHRVRDTIEEIFVLCLQALGERHIKVGFERLAMLSRVLLSQPDNDVPGLLSRCEHTALQTTKRRAVSRLSCNSSSLFTSVIRCSRWSRCTLTRSSYVASCYAIMYRI